MSSRNQAPHRPWATIVASVALALALIGGCEGAERAPPPTQAQSAPPGGDGAHPGTEQAARQPSSAVAGCAVLPADNIWNTPVDTLPVDSQSDVYIATIGAMLGFAVMMTLDVALG